jgi:membrane protease YdiL (CAAX protease family)
LTIAFTILAFFVGQLPLVIIGVVNKDNFDGSVSAFIELVGTNSFFVLQLIPFLFAFVALLFAVNRIDKRPILSVLTGRATFNWMRFFTSLIIWTSVMVVSLLVSYFSSNEIGWNFQLDKFIPLMFISLIMVPIQSSCEEVFFRGYLLQYIAQSSKRTWVAILITSIFFGLVHAGNPEVSILGYGILIYFILSGVFLAIIAVMDNGLELSMGYHAANNIFAALILTNDWKSFRTDALFIDHSAPTFSWESILTLLVFQPLMLFIFSRFYKWPSWKNLFFANNQ